MIESPAHDVWTSSVIWNVNAVFKSLLLNVLQDFKGYVCLIWNLFSWDSAGSIPSIRDLSEISRGGKAGGNFKFGFGNEVTHPCNGSEIF